MSLIDGKVEITPKNDGRIDPVQLLKATYDSGVSVAEMALVAQGQIIKNASGEIALQTQPSQSFVLSSNELSRELESIAGSNAQVTIKGLIYQKQKGQKKQTLPSSLSITVVQILQKQ